MSGFEYGNARLRAMRSRLLSRRTMMELAESRSLAEFISLLAQTPYRKSLELALVRTSDLESIFEALRHNFIDTVTKMRSFYDGAEGRLVDIILCQYDVFNFKTVLRGLSQQAKPADIESALLPSCVLPETLLDELMRASSLRGAIDLLATVRHPFAQPLLALRAESPGAEIGEVEGALDRWRFAEALRALKGDLEDGHRVLDAMRLELDVLNILLSLRLVRYPEERQVLKMRFGNDGLEGILPAEGTIPASFFDRIVATKSLNAALDVLADTRYAAAMQEGRHASERTGLLSEYERALRRYQLRWLSAQIVQDPLGIGVVLGYLAEKGNEISNVRRAARGVQMKQPQASIQAEMELVA